MFKVFATGPRAAIEAAWDALAWADPSPADAVDAKEESRTAWRLDAYAADAEATEACCVLIRETVPELSPSFEALEDRDWVKLSLEGLPAVTAGRFIVAGSHVLAETSPGKTAVLVEAGPAFGTGHHGTTLGCLLALNTLLRQRPPGRVLDLGTGTGVLAIAALKAGAKFALATDIDADSVDTAWENARTNQATARFKAIRATGTHHRQIQTRAPYDTVFANILAKPLVRLAPGIASVLAPKGRVILSGLLTHQEPMVRGAFAGRGLVLDQRIRRDGWSTLVYRKPGNAD
ncbi:MAG: 50S ribosomal protein L11 methyltransferase [Hyphomonadaceae bacterium]|nr:50S ribosomal protein L11 methyltransferase [Hyphomonadaceae bacterium]